MRVVAASGIFLETFLRLPLKKKIIQNLTKRELDYIDIKKKQKKKKIKIYEVLQFFLQTQLKSKNELTKDKIRTANVEMKVKKWVMMIYKREIYIYIYIYAHGDGGRLGLGGAMAPPLIYF